VGETVRYCIGVGKTLTALSLDEFRRFCPEVEEDVFDALQIETILARRCQPGATAPAQVRVALVEARKRLADI